MVVITMNPPVTTQRDHTDIPRPGLDDSGDSPLTGEDLIGDLDPGWLDWREEQANR
jgi:hypothetical protein